ncbi:AraC family transcriptional regulator [Micromonospora sp. WMMD1102]|uniref:AraC family transcriptional regulator n=1 Tax=Micromonospora sp. WMMD1102 TaxID=3016105 RepID=UPI002415208A|nr:AraC family transcriptional regulator [Micromonospora sp. WMMD1102]MDG4784754.1 AraC family transcriptional regulator [Micromonospora sp. WMMD1102]
MDVLSDLVAVMRSGRPRSARLAWPAPWAQEFGPVPGAVGFQVILGGPCWLIRPEAEPVPLAVGDVLFRAHGRGHVLADNPSTRPVAPACDPTVPQALVRSAAATGPGHGDSTGVDAGTVAGSAGVTVTLCGAYELDPARTHPLLHDLPELIHLPAHLGRHPELRSTVDLLAAELGTPRLGTDAIVPALLDTLLLFVLRAWFDRAPAAGSGWAAALRDPVTSVALRAIHREPARPWTVATLAAEAGLSRAPFARRFSTLLGRPPLAYLTWWRMTLAARLLRESDAPLTAIAGRVGYSSEFAFGAAFKRRYGIAPGRFRRTGHHGEV